MRHNMSCFLCCLFWFKSVSKIVCNIGVYTLKLIIYPYWLLYIHQLPVLHCTTSEETLGCSYILVFKVLFIIPRHCCTHWPCWLRAWGGASSLIKTRISQSALCTFASAYTLVTLPFCVKCRRTLKGTLHALTTKQNKNKQTKTKKCEKGSFCCRKRYGTLFF